MSADPFARTAWPPIGVQVVLVTPSPKGDAEFYVPRYAILQARSGYQHCIVELADGSVHRVAKERCRASSVAAARAALSTKSKSSVPAARTKKAEAVRPECGTETTIFDFLSPDHAETGAQK